MDWGRSYSSTWRVFRVNRETWEDGAEVGEVDAVGIERAAGGLIESGSMAVTEGIESDYYRIVMTAEQDAETERVEVATLLFGIASGMADHGTSTHSADGYSVLYPASAAYMRGGSYAPAGADGAQYVAGILREVVNAPVSVDGSFTLNGYVVHELGATVLDCAWAVLAAGNFTMQIDGHGTIHILPMPTQPELNLSSLNARLVMPGIEYEMDTSGVPNRYIAVLGDMMAEAVNDSGTSAVSTVSRGFAVDVLDTEPIPVNGETLQDYAERRLHELSTVCDTRTYTREFAPGVNVCDMVEAALDGMTGRLRIQRQSLTCGYGVTVTEKASYEEDLWQ